MRNKLYLILSLIFISGTILASDIELDGVYQGKNLYVMNPFASSGIGFCVYEVRVNGQLTTDEINSSAFEIDLSVYQFKIGEKVKVVLKHKDDCMPKVLNPEVLESKSTFSIVSMNIDNGKLVWTTQKEAGSLPFIVEQFRWNKWVKIGTVKGKGTPGNNTYSVVVHPHTGNNKFRVKQIDYTKKPHYSSEFTYKAKLPPVSFTPKKVTTEITFNVPTMYEIYDYYGNIVKKGFGAKIDVSGLKSGEYFLNYDNKMDTFKKK